MCRVSFFSSWVEAKDELRSIAQGLMLAAASKKSTCYLLNTTMMVDPEKSKDFNGATGPLIGVVQFECSS